jgi:hypothetical protein
MNAAVCACCTCAPLIRTIAAAPNAAVADLGAEGLPNLLELGADRMTRIGQSLGERNCTANMVAHHDSENSRRLHLSREWPSY